MTCNKCGKEVAEGSKFCGECGAPIANIENVQENNVLNNVSNQSNYNSNEKKTDNFSTISLILGIVAIVLVLISKPLGAVVAVVGLVFGLITKSRDKIRGWGIGLNIAAFFILAIIVVFNIVSNPKFLNQLYNELDYSSSDNYVAGTWNCSNFDGSGAEDDYSVTMKLNKDNTFVFGEYGDLSNNHAGGKYTFEDEKDKNENTTNGYKYFLINLNGNSNDYVVDGVSQNKSFDAKFEIGITSVNTKKQAILMNYYTYQMYYCYLEN